MALDALHDTFFDIHSQRGGYRWNVFASLNCASREQASQGDPPSQLGFVAIVAGLTALVLLAPVLLGSAARASGDPRRLFVHGRSFVPCRCRTDAALLGESERCRAIACRAQGRNPSCRRHRPSLAIGERRFGVERKRSAISGDFFPPGSLQLSRFALLSPPRRLPL